ncbi:hypothetical protein DL96DRAFT_1620881 [Flagelloscypha sp. PMI_526]|nr:hypothetical protein DL96DRAFT_1620881 [Flagelloscypha sp. PMI_526]
MKLWLLKRTSLLQRAATKVNHILCTRIIPSTPNVTTLCVIEQSSGYLKKITERLIPPLRCAIVVRRHDQWPSYRPADEIFFPSLQRLWVVWHAIYWPEIAAILASKAPNLMELGVTHPPSLSDANLFPKDPESLRHLRIFRWRSWSIYRAPRPYLGQFLKSLSPQLTQVSIRGFPIDLAGEQTIDISKLSAFSLEQRWVRSLELGILDQLETPGLCSSLKRFVLRCPSWGAEEVKRLFDALAYLRDSLKELFLYLPSYSTAKLIHIAKSTPRLESLHVVSDWWCTQDGPSWIKTPPFSDLANEVRSVGPQSLELRAWKLLDLTIRQRILDSSSNMELIDSIASFVPSIYSFYGLGHKKFQPSIERPLPDVDRMSMECGTSSWIQDDL